MAFTRKTEVRHISQAELIKIAEILNQPSTSPAWKKLMQIVPHELTHHEQLSDGIPKYNFQNIKSVETAGAKLNNGAQIFLEEWITSGRIRPTLSHLLQLFVKSELFRAADYVAINLLSEAPPQRPRKGPAAKIDISLPQDDDIDDNDSNSSAITNLNRCDFPTKNIASKQILHRSLIPDGPMSEEDLIRMAAPLRFSQNVTATPQPTQTTNGCLESPEIGATRIHMPHDAPSAPQQLTNGTSPSSSSSKTHRSEDQICHTQYSSQSESSHNFVPNFALLNIRSSASNNLNSHPNGFDNPNLSIFNAGYSDMSVPEQQAPHFTQLSEQHSNKSNVSTSAIESNKSNASTSAIESSSTSSTTHRSTGQTSTNQFYPSPESSHNFVPNFSLFRSNAANISEPSYVDIPNLPIFYGTEQRDSFVGNVPHLPQLLNPSQSTSVSLTTGETSTDQPESYAENVPHISQLLN